MNNETVDMALSDILFKGTTKNNFRATENKQDNLPVVQLHPFLLSP